MVSQDSGLRLGDADDALGSQEQDPISRFRTHNAHGEPESQRWGARIWAIDIYSKDADVLDKENEAHHQRMQEAWPRWEFRGKSWRVHVNRMARSHRFNVAAAVALSVNVGLRAAIASTPPQKKQVFLWESCSHALMSLSAVELLIRWLAPKGIVDTGQQYLRREWLILDELVLATYFIGLLVGALPESAGLRPLSRLLVSLQVLRLLSVLRLMELLPPTRPLHILLSGVSDGFINIVSASVFVIVIWLTFSILFTSVLRVGDSNEVIDSYFSDVPSSMLCMWETTVGGVAWGEKIVRPFFASDSTEMTLKGVMVLLAIVVSTFCLWNLVLGIYVRQAIRAAQDFDDQVDMSSGVAGQAGMRAVQKLLIDTDNETDKDGAITREDLHKLIQSDALRTMHIGKDELAVLHEALDREGDGKVPINELLFGILKLTGASKTVDMLSIDYKQRVLLRDVGLLDKQSVQQLGELQDAVVTVYGAAESLAGQVQELKRRVDKSRKELAEMVHEEELARSERNLEADRALAKARQKDQQRAAKHAVQAHMDSLQARIDDLVWARRAEAVCSGAVAGSSARLRQEVQWRLNSQVRPWLDAELARMGCS